MPPVFMAFLNMLRASFQTRAALQVEVLALRHQLHVLGLIRFRGHLLKGGYDVHDGSRGSKDAPATASV